MEAGTPSSVSAPPPPTTTIVSITIPYAVTTPLGSLAEETDRFVSNLCDETAGKNRCQITYAKVDTANVPVSNSKSMLQHTYLITIVGPMPQALSTRGTILRNDFSQMTVNVRASRKFLMSANGAVKAIAKTRLDAIMQTTKCHVSVIGQTLPPRASGSSSWDNHDAIEIEIYGLGEAVERARIDVLVFLDQLSGLHAESVEIDPKLHHSIAGRKRANLKQIMQDTMTNIFLPSPFVFQPTKEGNVAQDDREKILIWITGDRYGVQIAKETLLRSAESKKNNVLARSAVCHVRKIDWMLMNRKDSLRKILLDNGTFAVFPPIGIHHNIITVFGDDRVFVERTLRQINLLACEFYISVIQLAQPVLSLLGATFASPAPGDVNGNPVAKLIQNLFLGIGFGSRAEIVLKNNFVEMFGTDDAIKSAFQQIIELDFVKMYVRDTKFQIELAVEHKDFISGKKDGKVNKIVRQSGCRVTFQEQYNGYNMLVDVLNLYPSKALEGLALLEEELPAELSFGVPEAYHKRIIGVGGKNIQRVMKKYGVYVKFSNSEEFGELGGYYENDDNVIARTPMKNANNLESLKLAILDLVNTTKDLQDVEVTITIPREFHRAIIGRSGYNAREIEKRTRVLVTAPEKEKGSVEISLKGPEGYIAQAKAMLLDLVPEVLAIYITANNRSYEVLTSDEFVEEIMLRVKRDYDVDLFSFAADPNENEGLDQFWLVLEYRRNNLNAEHARKWLLEYLASKSITVEHAEPTRTAEFIANSTSDSMAFQPFSSQVFAPAQPEQQSFNYSLFDTEGFRNSRGAGSAPNLRGIFDDQTGRPINAIRKSQSELSENLFMDAVQNRSRKANASSSFSESDYGMPNYDSPTTYFPPAPFAQTGHPEESSSVSGISDSPPRPATSSDEGRMSPRMTMRGWSPPRSSDRGASPKRRNSPLRSYSPGQRAYSPIEEIFESPDPSDADEAVISDDMLTRILQMSMNDDEKADPKDKDYGPVRVVLESLGLQKFVDQFMDQEIDFPTFKTLDDGDLKTLGVHTLGARKKILKAISSLGGASPTS